MTTFSVKKKKKEILGLVLLFVFALLPRLFHLGERDVWMDEYRQSKYARGGLFDLDIVTGAAKQAQPPLDAAIQSTGITALGYGETGIRIHAAVLGALAVLFFFLAIRRLIPRSFFLYPLALVFAFHPWLVLFSQSGRPASSAVCFAVLYLWALIRFMTVHQKNTAQNRPTGLSFRWLALFTIIQAWFLLSTGFQPLIFVLTSCAALFPLLFNKDFTKKILYVYASTAVSFGLVFPVIKYNIDINAPVYLSSLSFFDKIAAILKNIFTFSFDTYSGYFHPFIDHYAIPFFIVCAVGIAGWFMLRVKESGANKKTASPQSALFLYFILFTLAFPQVYQSVFSTLIRYHVKVRYFVTFFPVLLALTALALFFAVKWLKTLPVPQFKLKNRQWKPVHLFIILLSTLFLFSFYASTQKMFRTYGSGNPEWSELYEMFSNRSAPGDLAYIVNLVRPGKWGPRGFYCDEFYYKKSSGQAVELMNRHTIADHLPLIIKNRRERNIYLVFHHGYRKMKTRFFKRIKHISIHRFNRLFVIRLLNRGDRLETLYRVFSRLDKFLPRDISNHFVYRFMFLLEMEKGNRENAQKYLRLLSKLDKKGKLTKTIRELEQLAAKKRVL